MDHVFSPSLRYFRDQLLQLEEGCQTNGFPSVTLSIAQQKLDLYNYNDTVYAEIFARRKFRHLLSLANILTTNFLFCVIDYIDNMATFTTLAKLNISAIQR